MFLRNSRGYTRRLPAMILGVYAAAAIIWPGAWSMSGASLGQTQAPGRNPEARNLKNPETQNAESIEAGKKLYQRHCAACHGPNGKGDGGMALSGGEPSDLTDGAWDYG